MALGFPRFLAGDWVPQARLWVAGPPLPVDLGAVAGAKPWSPGTEPPRLPCGPTHVHGPIKTWQVELLVHVATFVHILSECCVSNLDPNFWFPNIRAVVAVP